MEAAALPFPEDGPQLVGQGGDVVEGVALPLHEVVEPEVPVAVYVLPVVTGAHDGGDPLVCELAETLGGHVPVGELAEVVPEPGAGRRLHGDVGAEGVLDGAQHLRLGHRRRLHFEEAALDLPHRRRDGSLEEAFVYLLG